MLYELHYRTLFFSSREHTSIISSRDKKKNWLHNKEKKQDQIRTSKEMEVEVKESQLHAYFNMDIKHVLVNECF